MNEQSMRFRIGIFALASMILLTILIMLFGGLPTLLKGQDRYTIVFEYAPGVAPDTPVRRSGVRIGQVQRVDLDDVTGKVRVTILIDRPHVLFQDDQPVLVHGALSGDSSIDFVSPQPEPKPAEAPSPRSDGKGPQIKPVSFVLAQVAKDKPPPAAQPPERVPAKPGTEFTGTTQAGVAVLVNEFAKITPSAQEAFLEATRTLERYRRMSPQIEEAVRELRRSNDEFQVTVRNWGRVGERVDVLLQTNQDRLIKTLDNLSDAVVRVASVFSDENQRNLATTLKNVSAGSKNLESIAKNTDELLKESRQTISNLDQATKPMAERSGAIMKNLDESTERLNRTLTEVEALLRALNQGDGSLRRFLADPGLYNNLNEAAYLVTRLMPRLERILHDFEVFADKIARHPESLGIGGVVSPSSGLKESPTRSSLRPPSPGH